MVGENGPNFASLVRLSRHFHRGSTLSIMYIYIYIYGVQRTTTLDPRPIDQTMDSPLVLVGPQVGNRVIEDFCIDLLLGQYVCYCAVCSPPTSPNSRSQVQIVGPTSYWTRIHSFQVSLPSYSWDIAIWKFSFENQSPKWVRLTDWGLVTPFDNIDLGQHWRR